MKKNNILRILILLNNICWYFLWFFLIIFPVIFFVLKEELVSEVSMDTPMSLFLLTYTGLPDIAISIFFCLELVILILLALYITYNFKKLFKNLELKNVFVKSNVNYITYIAYTSLVIAIFWFDLANLYFALIFLLFAEIFKYGVQLESEKQLTI